MARSPGRIRQGRESRLAFVEGLVAVFDRRSQSGRHIRIPTDLRPPQKSSRAVPPSREGCPRARPDLWKATIGAVCRGRSLAPARGRGAQKIAIYTICPCGCIAAFMAESQRSIFPSGCCGCIVLRYRHRNTPPKSELFLTMARTYPSQFASSAAFI